MSALTAPLYVTAFNRDCNKFMLGGIFRMHDEVGFPVDCCIDEAKERGFEIDWLEALCDCWLNDCLKFDSFVRQAESCFRDPRELREKFSYTGTLVMCLFPKIKQCQNPVDVVCRYVMERKRKGSWERRLHESEV